MIRQVIFMIIIILCIFTLEDMKCIVYYCGSGKLFHSILGLSRTLDTLRYIAYIVINTKPSKKQGKAGKKYSIWGSVE